jgi:lysozyme
MSMSFVPIAAGPANQRLSLSAKGLADLMRREGVIRHYYNDAVNNCTYGVGSLAHLGPCSPQELHASLSNNQIVVSMQAGIDVAEDAIRRNVTHYRLTQQQFDALVSFIYNVGTGAARNVLRLVDKGQLLQAANTMMLYVHATVYGADGKPLRDKSGKIVTRILPALVARRKAESAPFR